jgi:hypothetical protein
MGNIVRWFEDFPGRALELMPEMIRVAAERDRIGSLSLLIAPSLIVAPYERLQTYARRRNVQADYLRFPDAHRRFDAVMQGRFRDAPFWGEEGRAALAGWKVSQVPHLGRDPALWQTRQGYRPQHDEFWHVDIASQQTRWVWKFLRDALAHWNVANADEGHHTFHEGGVMQRLVLYRAPDDNAPWDIISVSPEAFLGFLEDWTRFLSRGLAREMLAATEAA